MSAPDTRPFRVEAREEAGVSVLALAGELDIAGGPLFEDELRRLERIAGRRHVILDVAELEFVDSTGIRLVFEAAERATASGRPFSIRGMTPAVRRTFAIVGLLDVLPLED